MALTDRKVWSSSSMTRTCKALEFLRLCLRDLLSLSFHHARACFFCEIFASTNAGVFGMYICIYLVALYSSEIILFSDFAIFRAIFTALAFPLIWSSSFSPLIRENQFFRFGFWIILIMLLFCQIFAFLSSVFLAIGWKVFCVFVLWVIDKIVVTEHSFVIFTPDSCFSVVFAISCEVLGRF